MLHLRKAMDNNRTQMLKTLLTKATSKINSRINSNNSQNLRLNLMANSTLRNTTLVLFPVIFNPNSWIVSDVK